MISFGIEWKLETRLVSELRDYELNPRRINKDMYAKLKENIEKYGVIDRPCVNVDGVLIGGHQRTRVFRDMGITELDVWVPNRALSDDEVKKLNIVLNKVGGEFDYDVLANCFDVDDLLDLGFVENELLDFDAIGEIGDESEAVDDAVVKNDSPRSRLGDLYELGGHRLICGDATDADTVARLIGDEKPMLMVTDPPYGVEYDPEWREVAGKGTRAVGKVQNDMRIDWSEAYSLFPGDIMYVWHASWFTDIVAVSVKKCDFELVSHIIWVKQHFALSRSDYHWKHEPCWYAVRNGAKHQWRGGRKQSTVWEIANLNCFGKSSDFSDERTEHSTQKPVECMAKPICNHLKKGEIVYDPFLGSGTTLIAADLNGRRCFGVEIDPGYCDVIVDRYLSHCLRNGSSGEVILNGNKISWCQENGCAA